MRTTINLDERLLAAAKERAQEKRITLGELVEESLRQSLTQAEEQDSVPEIPVFKRGTGLRPGVSIDSTADLLDALDED